MLEYYHDLIYLAVIVQLLAAFTNKAWLLFLLVSMLAQRRGQ